jgi:transcriptional regulator with XRE-family HTH domain
LARAAGLSRSFLSRLELGRSRDVSLRAVAHLFAALGYELSVKGYPVGPPIRDAAQVPLLIRLRDRVSPTFRWTLESPMLAAGDLRAWDARLDGPTSIGVEAETRLVDVQEMLRRMSLKQRDSGVARVMLLVAATHANRRTLAQSLPVLRQTFPLDTREVLAALSRGRDPSGNGIVLL